MAAFVKRNWVRNKMKNYLADPVLKILPAEEDLLDRAIVSALVPYWTMVPWRFEQTVTVQAQNNPTPLPFAGILDAAKAANPNITTDDRSGMFYIGLQRLDEITQGTSILDLDAFLLALPLSPGVPLAGRSYYQTGRVGPGYLTDILKRVDLESEADTLAGNVEFFVDEVAQQLVLTSPAYFGQIYLWHAIGFNDEQLKFVPINNLDLFSVMAMIELLTGIVTARTTIILDAGYTVNVEGLQRSIEMFNERLRTDLYRMTTFAMTRG
jgi:hypothetical protein